MQLRRTLLGLDVIGSGSAIGDALRREAYMKIAWFAGDQPLDSIPRCFFTAITVRDLLNDIGESTVGGLYQLAALSPGGVRIVPYFYWTSVEPGFGTYVAMRIQDGEWLQEHRPTGTIVKVWSPFDFQMRHRDWLSRRSKTFEPAQFLTRASPGVIPDSNDRLFYNLYDPSDVPPQVRESWGDDPIAPLTWSNDAVKKRKRRRP